MNLTDKLECKLCDFKCCRPAELSRHLLTRKHQNRTTLNENNTSVATPSFVCKKCDKTYKARNSLWYHENKCKPVKMKEPDMSNKIEKLMADNQTILNFVTEQYHKTNKLLQMHMCHNATVDPPVVL